MMLDRLSQAARYAPVHPGFAAAFRFLRETNLAALAPGRHGLDGTRLYANHDLRTGVDRTGAVLEAHRRFIDVQYTLAGEERIGWRALSDCGSPRAPYDEARDIVFFDDPSESWIEVPPGSFAIFFPEDAHAPLAGTGLLDKIIVKVAVDWPV
jgi:biofilm protein TabA